MPILIIAVIIMMIIITPFAIIHIEAKYESTHKDLTSKFTNEISKLTTEFINKKYKFINELDSKLEKEKNKLDSELQKEKNKLDSELQKEKTILDSELQKEKNKLDSELQKEKNALDSKFKTKISEFEDKLYSLENKNLHEYTEKIIYNKLPSNKFKSEFSILKLNQEQFIKKYKIIKYLPYAKYSLQIIKKNKYKQILGYFDAKCKNIFQNLNLSDIDDSRNEIIKVFNTLNHIFKIDSINLSTELLDLKLKELNLLIKIDKKQQEEKEIQKAIREQMIEEEKVKKEIERKKLKIAKEEKQFNNEISKMLLYLQKSNNDAEKQIYIDKIKELEEKLKLLKKDKENVLQREINTRAGFVYIISNIGSFGENVFKIGMTRRLEPMERISELSSASVPFPFDVHAIIFSDDAPSLENSLHKYFEDKAINKVNLRKEFFKIDTSELKSYVLNNLDISVNFIDIPEAKQYRQSLKIIEETEVSDKV